MSVKNRCEFICCPLKKKELRQLPQLVQVALRSAEFAANLKLGP